MKTLLTILFVCLLPFLPKAQPYYVSNLIDKQPSFLKVIGESDLSYTPVIHYVSTGGNDVTGDGTIGNPWKTSAHAASVVSTIGDTIYVNAGTYTETSPIKLAVGVSLKGAGTSTIINSTYKADWNFSNPTEAAITLASTTEGTNGNQSVSNLILDGSDTTATLGILVKCRSNTNIHDITVRNFYINGINYLGSSVNSETKPTTYSVNNTLYNFVIDNCTDTDATWVGGGNINICGQQDLTIHDGNLSDTSRPEGANGDNILNNRFGRGLKIYNVNSYKPSSANAGWNFHFEIPWGEGGTEIYNCNFYGGDYCVDLGGNSPYNYNYAYLFSVHDNYFEDTHPEFDGTYGKYCLFAEGIYVKNLLLYNNTFKNIVRPFGLNDGGGTQPAIDSNIVFRNNVSYNTGTNTSTSYLNLIEIQKSVAGGSIIGLQIINNTIYPNPITHTTAVGIINADCSIKNLVIANNIFLNGTNGYWMNVINNGSGSIDSLIVRNNILYNNDNSNAATFSGNAVTHYINSGNLNSNPLFVSSSDLHLQAGSPAIGAAYPYGYGSDIGGYQYVAPPPNISISANQTITVSNTSVSAVGTAASGEVITGYAWTVSSGTGTFGSPTSASTTVTGLSSGANVLRCTVTQTDGQTAYKEVTITVNFPAPTANAGANQTITLPVSSANLSGSATVAPGQTATYLWTKVSGSGTQIITGNTTLTPSVSGMTTSGDYVFQLKVTQTDNQFATSTVTVHVNPSVTPQQPYVIFPVPIKVIQLR